MSVTKRMVNGEAVWVIDRRFRRKDGVVERYRRAALVQTKIAASQEEQDLILEFRSKGTIAHLVSPVVEPSPQNTEKVYVWEDAVSHYKKNVLPDLKTTTQRGYTQVLAGAYLAHFKGWKLVDIDYTAMEKWDQWVKRLLPHKGSRRREHIVLHAVLRSVGPNKGGKWLMLAQLPLFPAMPTAKDKQPSIPTDLDVSKILNEGRPGGATIQKWCRPKALERAQLAFALGLWAGLRAGEIRALRKSDIDIQTRMIKVSRNRSFGIEDTPKGEEPRPIKIADCLWERLEPRLNEITDPNGVVCLSYEDRPWDDAGIYAAWARTLKRLGIKPLKFHSTRHYFISSLFLFGADPITVMVTAGQKDLKTTMRYAHYQQQAQDRAIAKFSAGQRAEADANP